MAYGLYRKPLKIRKIYGNPRSKTNQKGLIVWNRSRNVIKSWVAKYGTKKQRMRIFKK